MWKKILLTLSLLLVIIFVLWKAFFNDSISNEIIIKPEFGEFEVIVTTTGELRAKNSINVKGPGSARSVGIWQLTISKLVDEGTTVDSGDFVAELDKADISEKIKEKQLSVEQLESQYLQEKLDSSLNLSAARDELENLIYELEEKELLQDQSKFEPPAVIRQAQINFEKVKRTFSQSKKNYITKVKKAIAKLSVVGADLQKQEQGLDRLLRTLAEFTINAPAPGMVIYKKEWGGRKRIVGSQISAWDPVVATLPDLSLMESTTYINEVDIQKIKKEQKVVIGLDANPDKMLTGKVINVANIGEQRKNSDSKVFEVSIEINEKDSSLLPAMTTSNEIIIETIKDALFIPLECVHTDEIDENKITYVYKKENGSSIKQEVELGLMNENEVVIINGIEKDDELLMNIPIDAIELEFKYLPEKVKKQKKAKKNHNDTLKIEEQAAN